MCNVIFILGNPVYLNKFFVIYKYYFNLALDVPSVRHSSSNSNMVKATRESTSEPRKVTLKLQEQLYVYCNNNIAPWVKRREKCLQSTQMTDVKATAAFSRISDIMPKAERGNYIVRIKEILSLALDGVLLLEVVNHRINNFRREERTIVSVSSHLHWTV